MRCDGVPAVHCAITDVSVLQIWTLFNLKNNKNKNKNVFLVTLTPEITIVFTLLLFSGHTLTQRNWVVPLPAALAQQLGRAYQAKAKFTVQTAGRVETIGPIGMGTVVRTFLWIWQGIACDCWGETQKTFQQKSPFIQRSWLASKK